ncbi:hypothetical protein AHAS_Ahas03G0170000 [Arachis hypogaea]
MADSSTSSTSQSDSKTKQSFHFRAKIEVQNIQVVANLRNLHQHTIKLSIKNLKRKQSNNTQGKFIKIPVYFSDYELGFTFLLRRCSRIYCYSCFFVTLFFYVVVLSSPVILVVLDLLVTDFWGLSPVQQSASEPADSNMMVVRKQTPSDALVIVPIQVFVSVSQTTTVLQIEGTTETTPEPPNNFKKPHPCFPQLHLKSAEDVAALMMMAQTASYVPKTDPVPSFSLGLTDSSQEEALTQETEKAKSPETANLLEKLDDLVQKIARNAAKEESKSPQIQRETGGESSGRFETPAGINENTDDMKQKCYIWGTRVKTYADGGTNEYENMCTLMAQDKYIFTKMHIASLQPATFIEVEIVSAMCLILN